MFFALGIKLVWREACRLADEERTALAKAGPARLRHDAWLPAMTERGDRQPATLRSHEPSAAGQREA